MKPVDILFEVQRAVAQVDGGHWQVMVTPPRMMQLPTQIVTLTADQYRRYREWLNGSILIQDALPELSRATREILLTGIGEQEFDDITRELDDEEENYRCDGDSKNG